VPILFRDDTHPRKGKNCYHAMPGIEKGLLCLAAHEHLQLHSANSGSLPHIEYEQHRHYQQLPAKYLVTMIMLDN
jgi:hypothetical protein